MSEFTVETAPQPGRTALWERLRSNPVVLKEFRSRMRGRRAFIILSVYVLLLSLLVSGVYLLMRQSMGIAGGLEERRIMGKTIFGLVVGMEMVMVSFVAPALTAGAISGERERQTYDLLRTTLLPARSLVFGKFFSALGFILLLLLAGLPVQSLAFLLGGVALEELLVGTLLLMVTAVMFCAAGVFFSSFLARTLVSTVLAYGLTSVLLFGMPLLLFVGILILEAASSNLLNPLTPGAEAALISIGWALVCTNPLAAGIATEAILLEEQSLISFSPTISNGVTITLISPWIPFVIIYLIGSVLLLLSAARFVRRLEK